METNVELILDIELIAGIEKTEETVEYCKQQTIDRLTTPNKIAYGIIRDNEIIAYVRFKEKV